MSAVGVHGVIGRRVQQLVQAVPGAGIVCVTHHHRVMAQCSVRYVIIDFYPPLYVEGGYEWEDDESKSSGRRKFLSNTTKGSLECAIFSSTESSNLN